MLMVGGRGCARGVGPAGRCWAGCCPCRCGAHVRGLLSGTTPGGAGTAASSWPRGARTRVRGRTSTSLMARCAWRRGRR